MAEITDVTRTSNVQGDGNVRTNLFRNGQCDAATDWTFQTAGVTSAVDATVAAPLASQSIKVTMDGSVSGQEVGAISGSGQAALAGTVGVGSVYVKGTAGASYSARLGWTNTDTSFTPGSFVTFTATGSWQQIVLPSVAVAVGKTGDRLRIQIGVPVGVTRADIFWLAHAMLEKGQASVGTYIPTSGGVTASQGQDSSFGIWTATTNLVLNGGFETNTTGWQGYAQGSTPIPTVTRDTTTAKFGGASGRVDTSGAAGTEGAIYTPLSISASAAYSLSGWFKAPAGSGFRLQIDWKTSGGAYVFSSLVDVTATGDWQRCTFTDTAPATAGTATIAVYATGTASARTFWVDGIQLEQKLVATPYVHTNGATATRAGGRVQAPASLLNATQGWAAFRIRPGWSSAQGPSGVNGGLLMWGDDTNNRITLDWQATGTRFRMRRMSAGVSGVDAVTTAQTFSAGTLATVVVAWTATTLFVSVNGAAFATAANSIIPALAATTFDIGSAGTIFPNPIDGDVLWFACGLGTLTNGDAATINSFGNVDPVVAQFPASAVPTGVWHANDAQMRYGHQMTLLASGNEITDAARALNVQGDGRSNDSSFGIWEATTNLITNGGAETSAVSGGVLGTTATITRDTTVAKFGSASFKVVTT